MGKNIVFGLVSSYFLKHNAFKHKFNSVRFAIFSFEMQAEREDLCLLEHDKHAPRCDF